MPTVGSGNYSALSWGPQSGCHRLAGESSTRTTLLKAQGLHKHRKGNPRIRRFLEYTPLITCVIVEARDGSIPENRIT
jgi:hypothetical protein